MLQWSEERRGWRGVERRKEPAVLKRMPHSNELRVHLWYVNKVTDYSSDPVYAQTHSHMILVSSAFVEGMCI